MTSWYDLLGCSPDATEEELRQAYRRAAFRVHPDVNPGVAAEAAIRRLNQAWAVLGDPDRRRRYDAEIGLAGASSAAPHPPPTPPRRDPSDDWMREPRRSRLLRPSFVVVAILVVIFVVTAYAGSSDHRKNPTAPAPTTASTAPLSEGSPVAPQASIGGDGSGGAAGANLVGKCILRLLGYDAIVLCDEHGAQMVAAEVAASSECPAGTTVYQLEGRSQLVCLNSSGS